MMMPTLLGTISVNAEAVTVNEGSVAVFTLELTDAVTDEPIVVEWSVDCGGVSDVTGDDFGGDCPSGIATIAAGQASTIFTITTVVDSVVENAEEFRVTLTSLTGISSDIADRITISESMSTASVTIADGDEAVLSLSAPAFVEESATGMSVATFTVSLTGGVTTVADITVPWRVDCAASVASAADFADEVCPSGTVTIASGESFATFAVSTNDDNVVEGMESFSVRLSSVLSVSPDIDGRITISDSEGTASVDIRDNDTGTIEILFERGFRTVTGGNRHSCGLRENGEVGCWGLGTVPGIGNEASDIVGVDVDQGVPPAGAFREVSGNGFYTCGIIDGGDRDGRVECWGFSPDIPSEVADVRFRTVSTGNSHACGIREDNGKAECWGAVNNGQTTLATSDGTDLSDVRFRALSAGRDHTCGIVDGDFVIDGVNIDDGEVECWGRNNNEQTTLVTPDGTELSDVRFPCIERRRVPHVRYSRRRLYNRRRSYWRWRSGMLGEGMIGSNLLSAGSAGTRTSVFRALGAGVTHTCGIVDGDFVIDGVNIGDGEVTCWGTDDTNGRTSPPPGLRLLALGAGRDHNCGIGEDGTVACWGRGC